MSVGVEVMHKERKSRVGLKDCLGSVCNNGQDGGLPGAVFVIDGLLHVLQLCKRRESFVHVQILIDQMSNGLVFDWHSNTGCKLTLIPFINQTLSCPAF